MSKYTIYYAKQDQISYNNGASWLNVNQPYKSDEIYGSELPSCDVEEPISRVITYPITEKYICNGTSKYYVNQNQQSIDSGVTWTNVGEEYAGNLYEENSEDCGYVPPTTSVTQYWVMCDGVKTYFNNNKIPEGYFSGNKNIKKVIIGSMMTYIGKNAFSYCTNLTTLEIQSGSPKYFEDYSFYKCTSLETITISGNYSPYLFGSYCFGGGVPATYITFKNTKEYWWFWGGPALGTNWNSYITQIKCANGTIRVSGNSIVNT